MSPSNQNSKDFDILSEILEQIREVRTRVDGVATNQVTRADLAAYVLKEVFEVEVKRLDGKDAAQQNDLDGLLNRELGQGQRIAIYASVVGSLVFGCVSLLHSFIR